MICYSERQSALKTALRHVPQTHFLKNEVAFLWKLPKVTRVNIKVFHSKLCIDVSHSIQHPRPRGAAHPGVCFFLLWPVLLPIRLLLLLPFAAAKKTAWVVIFFSSSLPLRGAEQKKTPWPPASCWGNWSVQGRFLPTSCWRYPFWKFLLFATSSRKFISEVWLLENCTLEGFESVSLLFFESVQHSGSQQGSCHAWALRKSCRAAETFRL